LLPNHPAATSIKDAIAAESPDIIVEALFFWPKPTGTELATGTTRAQTTELLTIYNILRAAGSLQGIEYWSASRRAMRLFYETSHLIASPENDAAVPDSMLPTLPPVAETLYARQKDLSFGDNRYKIVMGSGPDHIQSHSVNLTQMRYGILPVASPGNLSVRILVINGDDALLFYLLSSARAAMVPGMRGKLESSFGNRATAIYNWFAGKAGLAWTGLPPSN
jgi:hypothetical protein